jgi:hypothetical protein
MGPTVLLPLRRKLFYGLLSPFKVHRPLQGLNPRTLGPVSRTISTRSLRTARTDLTKLSIFKILRPSVLEVGLLLTFLMKIKYLLSPLFIFISVFFSVYPRSFSRFRMASYFTSLVVTNKASSSTETLRFGSDFSVWHWTLSWLTGQNIRSRPPNTWNLESCGMYCCVLKYMLTNIYLTIR